MHILAMAQATRRLARKPVAALLSALVIAIALTLPALGYVLLDNLGDLARGAANRPEISIFLRRDTPPERVSALETRLRSDKRIATVRFVPRDLALEQLAQRGGIADVTAELAENPLPDAFVLEPHSAEPERFEALRAEFAATPDVEFVQLDAAWVERLHALVGFGRDLMVLLAGLLGTALVIVTFNTIRLQILTQRHEVSVSLLLGATRPFVRRPYLYFGLLQGLLGGLLAWLGLHLLMQVIGPQIETFARSYNIVMAARGPGPVQGLALVGFAALLGWIGAGLSVFRHLHDGAVD